MQPEYTTSKKLDESYHFAPFCLIGKKMGQVLVVSGEERSEGGASKIDLLRKFAIHRLPST